MWNLFFFITLNTCAKKENFFLENPKILSKKWIFIWELSKFDPSKKFFSADMNELEHTKNVVKMSKFWDDPPPTCENLQYSVAKATLHSQMSVRLSVS